MLHVKLLSYISDIAYIMYFFADFQNDDDQCQRDDVQSRDAFWVVVPAAFIAFWSLQQYRG